VRLHPLWGSLSPRTARAHICNLHLAERIRGIAAAGTFIPHALSQRCAAGRGPAPLAHFVVKRTPRRRRGQPFIPKLVRTQVLGMAWVG
jgi:hypothetical protein